MTLKKISILFFILVCTGSFAQDGSNAYKHIISNLKAQETSWNQGDIDSYMAYYWNSDSLKFIGKSGITYGWKTTLEHYKKSYPDKAAMGVLTFADIKLQRVKRNLIMVTGSWKLIRDKDTLSGFYSLFWKRIKGKWVIIVDHTS